jgi:hypothetical protein
MADNLFVISSTSGESVRRTDGFAKAFITGSYVALTAPRAGQLLKSLGRRRVLVGAAEMGLKLGRGIEREEFDNNDE